MQIIASGLLIQVFLAILKLTHTIDWSWWVVLIPYEVIMVLYFVGLWATSRKKETTEEWEKAKEEWRKLSKK